MEINIKNCNNIDEGSISIKENVLNIKFGVNGTGKSTIAKAIRYSIDKTNDLAVLTPFKLLESNEGKLKPEVLGIDSIESIFMFDEGYVKQFTFKQDELIEKSFEIFIKTPTYQKKVEEIESLVLDVTNLFKNNPELNTAIDEFKKLSDNFKVTKDGISKASKGYKSLIDGNKIKNIPKGLEPYKDFLESNQIINWLDWHNKGEDFLGISESCPYCVSAIGGNKELIKKVASEYDKNIIKNLGLLIETIEKLGEYFSDEAKLTLKKITTKKDGLEQAEEDFLVSVKKQIDDLIVKFEKLKFMTHADFKDVEKVDELIRSLKIEDIDLYDRLKSNKTKEVVHSINSSLDAVLKRINDLQREVGQQKTEVKKLINKHQGGINQFLKNAGFKYEVKIDAIGYKLKLKHIDSSNLLSGGDQHLSFGERNAFALVLFMYESLSKNPDLIVLDDPISSFDDNKKYAILEMLFRQDECLKNRTVLMLTHDIEPVIDTTKVLKPFKDLSKSCFLELKNGILTEQNIEKGDILTFSQICNEVVKTDAVDEIIKLVYLRRDYEVTDDKGNEYEVLSNLFHKRNRQKAEDHRLDDGEPLSKENFEDGVESIKGRIPSFDYERILNNIQNIQGIKKLYNSTNNNYEKLQLFRIHNEDDVNGITQKYIKELYHIENELINQLNPLKFNLVPEFIIKECDEIINPRLEVNKK